MSNTSRLNSIKLFCPNCKQRHQLRMEFLGEVLTCVHCRHKFKPHVVLPCPFCRDNLSVGLEILGRDTSCQHCGERFRAEIRAQCPLCPQELKILPEFIGHRVTCKGCKQTIRANLSDGRIVVSGVFPEARSGPEVGGESELQIPVIAGHVTESQVGMDAAQARSVQHPVDAPPANCLSFQETLREASALRNPLEDEDRFAELPDLRAQLAQSQAWAQQAEIERLQAELKKSQILKAEDDAARVKESERHSRLVKALEKAQTKHESLRAARETAQHEAESLRVRVHELERTLAEKDAARAYAEDAHARELEEERGRTAAELQAQHAQWELKLENVLCKEEEFRTATEKLEADRQRLQLQTDAMRGHSEQERGILMEEVTQLREQAARIAMERDTALERVDSLISARDGLTEQIQAAARASREAEDRLQAEIVVRKQDLGAAREQAENTARRLSAVAQQLCAEQKEREKQRQSELPQTQKLVALEEKLRIAQSVAEEEKKQRLFLDLKSAENCALLKAEVQRLEEGNAALREELDRLSSGCNEGDRYRQELIQQVQDVESLLEQEKLRAAALHQELDSTKRGAELELARLTASWTEDRTRLQTEERHGQDLLAAAVRTFDQERTAMHCEIERLQQEIGGLKVEGDGFRGQLTHLTQENLRLKLDCDERRVSHEDAEQRWRSEATRLSQAALQAQQDLLKLQKELEEHRQRESIQLSQLAGLQQERETAQHEADAAKKDLDTLREVFERDRLGLTAELEEQRQKLLQSNSEDPSIAKIQSAPANGSVPDANTERAPPNLDAHMDDTRHSDFAKKIKTLGTDHRRQKAAQGKTWRSHWGLALFRRPLRYFWNRPVKSPEDSQKGEPGNQPV